MLQVVYPIKLPFGCHYLRRMPCVSAVGGAHQFYASILLAISPQMSRHIHCVGMFVVESGEEPVGAARLVVPIILTAPCLAVVVGEEHTAFAACQPTVGVGRMECRLVYAVVTGKAERIAVVVPCLTAVVTDVDMAFKDASFTTIINNGRTCTVKADKRCGSVTIKEFSQVLPSLAEVRREEHAPIERRDQQRVWVCRMLGEAGQTLIFLPSEDFGSYVLVCLPSTCILG